MFFKSVDEKIKDIGFIKRCEQSSWVSYEREDPKYKYIQCVDIYQKNNGNHIIISFQKGVNGDGFNNSVGLTYLEAKLFMKKYRQMKRRYFW